MSKRSTFLVATLFVAGALAISAKDESPPPDPSAKARMELAGRIYNEEYDRAVQSAVAPPAAAGEPNQTFDPALAEQLNLWSRRWMDARRDDARDRAGRVAAAKAHLDRVRKLEGGGILKDAIRNLQGENKKEFKLDDEALEMFKLKPFLAHMQFFRLEAESILAKEEAR